MKALIQRVKNAKVTVSDEVISSIEQGLCIFIGISKNDTKKEMEQIVKKILSVKLFDGDSDKKWMKSVVDNQLEILCVSQFTLYNTWKGSRPDFHNAMPGEKSKEFYENFVQMLKAAYKPEKVKNGKFGSFMQVSIQNDGPTTFEIEYSSSTQSKDSRKVTNGKETVQGDSSKQLENDVNGLTLKD